MDMNNPLRFIDPLGLRLRITGSSSLSRQRVQSVLDTVRGTPRGGEIVKLLEESEEDFVIRAESEENVCRVVGEPPTTVRFNPDLERTIITSGGREPVSPERALVHELGHLLEPTRPDFDAGNTTPETNVGRNENPVAEALAVLGQRPRIRQTRLPEESLFGNGE
jgi:hypothetical protein